MNTSTGPPALGSINFWSWVFPLSYVIHIAEEYWGGEGYPAYIARLGGASMSPSRFLVAQGIGLVLMTMGVVLARRFNFSPMMLIILAVTVLVNAVTHVAMALSAINYSPGLWSSVFIWMPLSIFTLFRFRNTLSSKRYWIAVAIGVAVNVVVGLLTLSGGRLVLLLVI
jgi:Protein of unknown function with HXXEE motif